MEPRGFTGSVSPGANALAYWAILAVPAALAAVFLAAVPLLTLFLAALHGLEQIRVRGIVGGMLTILGIAVLHNPEIGAGIAPLALLALVGSVICAGEAGIIAKKYPSHHPAATNGVAMLAGAAALLAASGVWGESWLLPSRGDTWVALAHLSLLGTVGLFAPYLFVLQRWSASATSYSTVLMPVVAVALGVIMLDQEFSLGMVAATALIVAGVYVGALSRPRVPVPAPAAEEALAQRCTAT